MTDIDPYRFAIPRNAKRIHRVDLRELDGHYTLCGQHAGEIALFWQDPTRMEKCRTCEKVWMSRKARDDADSRP